MERPQRPDQHPDADASTFRPRDSAAWMAGVFLVFTVLVTVVAVVARVAADADESTLLASLAAISERKGLYAIGGASRLVSGITLIVGAWFLLRTWIIRERLGTPAVPGLFAVSAIFTGLSGALAVALAASVSEATDLAATDASTQTIAYLRWFTGKLGFAGAGIALLLAAKYQWKVGGTLRYISPLSVAIGVAMQFIWWDAVSVLHRISGVAFLVWLLVIGLMLLTGRVERHFAGSPAHPYEETRPAD